MAQSPPEPSEPGRAVEPTHGSSATAGSQQGAFDDGETPRVDDRGPWRRFLDRRATRRDPRWPLALPWRDTHASGFRTPARMCPRGCSSEVARREILTFTTWSGRVELRVYFDYESSNCDVCGSPRIDRCPRCRAEILAPVTDRCEFCGLPQPWSPDRLTAQRRTPPREWGPGDGAPAQRIFPKSKGRPRRQLLVVDDDITNLAVDAVVSNDDLNGHMYTVIASAIKAAAGQSVEDLSIDHGRTRTGKAWFTNPGRLNRLKGIIHVAAMDQRGATSIETIQACVRSALDLAVKHDCRSVALATFGIEPETEDREVVTLEQWLSRVVPVVVDYLKRLPETTDLLVLLVLFEPDNFAARVDQLRELCGTARRRTSDPSPEPQPHGGSSPS